MPDISMCSNDECPLSKTCYRFNAKPSEYRQSYTRFTPKIDEVLDEVECDYYINPIEYD
jgi:hypothetical protein